jgi:hypothetical protein
MKELVCHSSPSEFPEWIDGVFSLGIDDGDNRFGDLIRNGMMISDDDIDSERVSMADGSDITRSTIDSDDKFYIFL